MISKSFAVLIFILSLLWFGIALASISVGESFIFECPGDCPLGEEVMSFFREGVGVKSYAVIVDNAGSFSIDQNDIYKFKIDSSGNISWIGALAEGGFDFTTLASNTCSGGFAYGVNSDGWLCVDACDEECRTLSGDTYRSCVNEAAGEQAGCNTACRKCNGDGACVAFTNNTQDSEGSNKCEGLCQACYGGVCSNAPSGADPGNDCPVELCYTGNCSGGGACAAYNDGLIHGCSSCKFCNDADVQCEVRPGYYHDYRCGTCRMCDFIGNCVQSSSTHWNKSLFGCYGSTSRCVAGVCRTCGGYLANDNCYGCVHQGGTACWYYGGDPGIFPGFSCNTTCGSRGCVVEDWNDDNSCSICKHWWSSASCDNKGWNFVPGYFNVLATNDCYYRSPGFTQNCSLTTNEGWSRRLCVCNW